MANKGRIIKPKIQGVKKGDITRVSEIVGCSARYVEMVLHGTRDNQSPLAKRIVKALQEIIANRNKLKAQQTAA